MKNITTLTLTLAFTLTAFGGCNDSKSGGSGESKSVEGAAAAPTLTINEADWVAKDLSTIAPGIRVSMKVPKTATLEKNGNGGVDVKINEFYMLTVSSQAVSNIKEAMTDDKSTTVGNSRYINSKTMTDEPNGFVYSIQMKDEENGTKYQPEAHFAFYVEKDGAIYSIKDEKVSSGTPGSAFSANLATKVYALVKGSAKTI